MVVSCRGVGTARRLKLAIAGRVGVRTELEGAEDFGRGGSLVAEPEDEDAGLDLFGREQAEAAGLPPEFDL